MNLGNALRRGFHAKVWDNFGSFHLPIGFLKRGDGNNWSYPHAVGNTGDRVVRLLDMEMRNTLESCLHHEMRLCHFADNWAEPIFYCNGMGS